MGVACITTHNASFPDAANATDLNLSCSTECATDVCDMPCFACRARKSNSNSLQSPFSDVCCLHMTLTNKGFQNACWPLEDMVHILVDIVH